MILDFSISRQVRISMVDYVKEIIDAWDKAPKLSDDGFKLVESKRAKRA